jgi:hypothetical protein
MVCYFCYFLRYYFDCCSAFVAVLVLAFLFTFIFIVHYKLVWSICLGCTNCPTRNIHKFVCIQQLCMECVEMIDCKVCVLFFHCSGILLLESLWAIK